MTPDVNVLVAASRADHVHHAPALQWLSASLQEAPAALCLLPTVVASFLRLVTHPRVFQRPTPMPDALAFVDAIRQVAGSGASAHEDEAWPQLRQLCLDKRLSANDVPDAWIAAQVLTRGEVLATFDHDFMKLLPPSHLLWLRPAQD